MSQQFGSDCQMASAAVSIPTTTETTVLTLNALRVPFLNGKMVVMGVVFVTWGTGTTSANLRVRRNASAENIVLGGGALGLTAVAGQTVAIPFAFNDQVPDGRDCIYSLTIQQVAATGNGSALAGSTMDGIVLSG